MKRSDGSVSLAGFKNLQTLSPPILKALEQIAVVYKLKHRELLYHQGEAAHSIYLIQRGGIHLIEQAANGYEVNIKIYGAGDLIGLLAISGSHPHPSRAEAIGDSEVIAIRGEQMRTLIEQHSALALLIIDLLVDHVHKSHARVRQLASERVEQRLARALLHYCDKFGQERENGIYINAIVSQQDMARFAGATVETVNRTLRIWQDEGIVRVSRQHFDVLDYDQLHTLAEDRPLLMQD